MMPIGRKLTLLIIAIFTLAIAAGYLLGQESILARSAAVACFTLGVVLALLGYRNIFDEVQNRYYWYEQLLDALPTPLSVTDLEMNWTFINKPVEKLFHEPKRGFEGRPCSNWGAPICNSEKCGIKRLREGNTETFFSQFDREFRVDTHYLHNLKGERVGHVEVCTDITAILKVAQAAQSEKLSKQRLEKAYEELKLAQQSLLESEKMASLGSLVAGIAHEINTPIGICVTAASYLQGVSEEFSQRVASKQVTMSYVDEFIDNLTESTGLLNTNLRRAADLITSFKQVAVDQSSGLRYRFRMAEHLDQVLLSLGHQIKRGNCKVEVNCDPELELDSYPGVLVQIYSNLIQNSIIHGFDEQTNPRLITIEVYRDENSVFIDYRDNGKGIPEDLRLKIFEPFVTSKRGQGGTGLGTYIIYNLVTQKLKGTIRCESNPGEGCLFNIQIPLNEASNQGDTKPESQELKIDTKVSYE